MNRLILILATGILTIVFSCGQNDKKRETTESRELVPNPEGQTKDTLLIANTETQCNFLKVLADPKTPKLAKELLNITATYSEEPLDYFDSLKSKDKETREFYFRVITNSYKMADGAYAEGLGNLGKEYIERNPKAFATFFDNKICFTDTDLKTWAKIALLEFAIIDESIETGKGVPLVKGYCKQLIKTSVEYSDSQKRTIKKFTDFLLNEWRKFLKEMD